MSELAIRAEALSKAYRINRVQTMTRYRTLQEEIVGLVRRPFRPRGGGGRETMWALKDVSFEVKHGEVVGIIGRNGAGKSTLLKILSRITEPTGGYADIFGRVGSLLEVGTGFHPELTGRENIFLSGAILGMTKAEIRAKFDEIVAFAEVEKFIDTPAKHYSSGMYVRLAFAVAAHLEPEILLVDEVLAVGDIAFQKKCLKKMGDVAGEGRTVLFVSHNTAAVKSLCQRGVLLSEGKVALQGDVSDAVRTYIGSNSCDPREREIPREAHATGISKVRARRIKLLSNDESSGFVVFWRQPISLAVEIEVLQPVVNAVFGVGIVTSEGVSVLTVHHNDEGGEPWALSPGVYEIRVELENPLRAGTYRIVVGAHEAIAKSSIIYIPEAAQLQVLDVSASDGEHYIHHNSGLINGTSAWVPPQPIG